MTAAQLRLALLLAMARRLSRMRIRFLMARLRGAIIGNVPSFRTGGILVTAGGATIALTAAFWMPAQSRPAVQHKTLAEYQRVMARQPVIDVAEVEEIREAKSRHTRIEAIVARQLALAALDRAKRRVALAAMESGEQSVGEIKAAAMAR